MSNKYEEKAQVISQKMLVDGIYDLVIKTDKIAKEAKAGQFVSVYSSNPAKLLPRPISLCGIDSDANTIRLVYRVTGENTGTEEFSKLKSGDTIRILGPLGNGFPVDSKKAFLIGGGIGVPPMLQLAKNMNKEGFGDFEIIMGYRDKNTFLKDEFEKEAKTYIATEDGSLGTKGNVIDAIKANSLKADVIYACGPMPMLKALKEYASENNMECFISLEERMACGIGACLACVSKSKTKDHHTNVNNKRICVEGPVFDAKEVDI